MDIDLIDLGRMAYGPCVEVQRRLVDEVAAGGRPSTLVFVEHDPVLTLGASFHEENLLLPVAEFARRGIEVVRTDRGGDVTYHGPGQLVIYPIFDLSLVGRDLHQWLRQLEEAVIVTLGVYGLKGERFPPHTGTWVGERKIAAIAIKVKMWVSMHGVALNCDNDMGAFDLIVPCGIKGYGVTSLTQELKRPVTVDEAKPVVANAFVELFGQSIG